MRIKLFGVGVTMTLVVVLLGGCATAQDPDPLEGYNRIAFQFNMDFNKTFVEPAVSGYQYVVPSEARTGVRNFFNNVFTVPDITNDILQLNWRYTLNDIGRLVLNTTVGLFGLIDVASKVGLEPHTQSFGLTLARWGIWRNSPYFIIPILGPSTLRDTIGLVPDYLMTPIRYVKPTWYQYPIAGLYILQLASDTLPKLNFITQDAIDPYVAMRNAYMQNRKLIFQRIMHYGQIPVGGIQGDEQNIHGALNVDSVDTVPSTQPVYPSVENRQKLKNKPSQ